MTEDRPGRDRDALEKFVADLAHDLLKLQDSLQVARAVRMGIAEPAAVWPDAPVSIDDLAQAPALALAEENTADSLERPAAREEEDLSDSALQGMYPTFPV